MADAPSESDSTTKRKPIPFSQVTLPQILYAVALIAVGLSFFTGTIFFSVLALLMWKQEFAVLDNHRTAKWGLILAAVSVLILGAVSQMAHVRGPAQRASCMNNMRHLSFGISNYESAYAQFPRPFARNMEHAQSWRVLILPFIEEQSLYDRYHLDEPWDSPSNQKLADAMPDLFRCLANPMGNLTPYKLVTGTGTVFAPDPVATRRSGIAAFSGTTVIVEDVAAPVHWMDPEDLTIDEALVLLNEMTYPTCAHREDRVFSTTYCGIVFSKLNGAVHFRNFSSAHPVSRSSFLFSEETDVYDEIKGESITAAKPFAYFILFIYGILMILPGFFIPGILTR